MTKEQLRNKYERERGNEWENEDGEPDIEYVWWFEEMILRPTCQHLNTKEGGYCEDCGIKL